MSFIVASISKYFILLNYTEIDTNELQYASAKSYFQKLMDQSHSNCNDHCDYCYWRVKCMGMLVDPFFNIMSKKTI